ncbi:hypothetical protein AAY473_031992 [Plecturocebus cupreus]
MEQDAEPEGRPDASDRCLLCRRQEPHPFRSSALERPEPGPESGMVPEAQGVDETGDARGTRVSHREDAGCAISSCLYS